MIKELSLGNYKTKIYYEVNAALVSYIIIEEVIDTINIIDVFTKKKKEKKDIALNYLIIYLKIIKLKSICSKLDKAILRQ